MRYFSAILVFGFMAGSAMAAGTSGTVLDYQVIVRLRDQPEAQVSRLQVATTPPVATHNHVKRLRFVGWKVKALPGKGGLPPASVLARVAGLLYLEAPTPALVPREGGMHFGKRFCRLWQARTPSSVGAFVYLVEVAPDLLALSYLSVSLPEGEIASLEMRLDGVTLGTAPAPAEDGMALLRTLRSWGALSEAANDAVDVEQVN
jgi:hypothetical protein